MKLKQIKLMTSFVFIVSFIMLIFMSSFSPEKYPVLAFRGAPASYPVLKENRHYQRYLVPSERIENEAQGYIDEHFKGERFVGIHLRIASDWVSNEYTMISRKHGMSEIYLKEMLLSRFKLHTDRESNFVK